MAKTLGYPKVAQKPVSSSKTGQAGCPKASEVAYEDSAGKTALIPEILACNSTKSAASVLTKLRKSVTGGTPQTAPKQLGSTAFEVSSAQVSYAIVWQRGKSIGIMQFNTNVPATSSTSTSTTPPPTPITAGQQTTLSRAALAQDKMLK
ncbi:MAG TPA: hypothetical protein VHZ02_06665 [Acidimicrobiales bacterium]|nr:hypothetical protein [Acidimicrobiales bacterium]